MGAVEGGTVVRASSPPSPTMVSARLRTASLGRRRRTWGRVGWARCEIWACLGARVRACPKRMYGIATNLQGAGKRGSGVDGRVVRQQSNARLRLAEYGCTWRCDVWRIAGRPLPDRETMMCRSPITVTGMCGTYARHGTGTDRVSCAPCTPRLPRGSCPG